MAAQFWQYRKTSQEEYSLLMEKCAIHNSLRIRKSEIGAGASPAPTISSEIVGATLAVAPIAVSPIAVSPTHIGTGSGFWVADGKHLVTNHHVIACIDEGGKVGIMAASGELVQAAVLWQSASKDLAILRVDKNQGGQVVSFATRSTMDERDKVISAGYPGAALRSIRDFGRVSFAEGIISKFTELDSPEGTVRHIQITAPRQPG